MSVVIILGAQNDYHANHMLDACRKRGHDARLFDTSLFPSQHTISWDPGSGHGQLSLNGQNISFEQIKSVFWSTLSSPVSNTEQTAMQVALTDSQSMLRTFFAQPTFKWCNSWYVYDFHKVKPRQLELAAKLGAKIPETYTGNDAQEVGKFVAAHTRVLFKPVYGGAHATLVDPSQLTQSHLSIALKQAPVTLQNYIDGTNIRTFVIDNDVFSAEIRSTQVDFRRHHKVPHFCIDTPEPVRRLALLITESFGMRWTAIDWRRDLNGRYYFLEANPSPMFIHFEKITRYRITDRLVSLLIT